MGVLFQEKVPVPILQNPKDTPLNNKFPKYSIVAETLIGSALKNPIQPLTGLKTKKISEL